MSGGLSRAKGPAVNIYKRSFSFVAWVNLIHRNSLLSGYFYWGGGGFGGFGGLVVKSKAGKTSAQLRNSDLKVIVKRKFGWVDFSL